MRVPFLVVAVMALSENGAPSPAGAPVLRWAFFARGEHGSARVAGPILTVRAGEPAPGRQTLVEWTLDRERDDLEGVSWPQSVSIEVVGPSARLVSGGEPGGGRDLALGCDPENSVDLSKTNRGLARALPAHSRIKGILAILGKTLVAFSTVQEMVVYDVRVALLEKTGAGKYRRVATDTVSRDGHYCGIQALGDSAAVILIGEPTGSSSYLDAHGYLVSDPRP